MSRKSDISKCLGLWASGKCEVSEAIAYAHDLGRASVLESMRKLRTYDSAENTAKRLRAKVRRAGETR